MSFTCLLCDRSFVNNGALQQHKRDSPVHTRPSNCDDCNRTFSSGDALELHLLFSPAHAKSFDCNDCNRSFDSREALKQHLRDSPAHTKSLDSEDCNQSFASGEALEQHPRHSPAHTESFGCKECNRSFGGRKALEQHLRDSPAHQAPETPLDAFFRSFPTFDYDPAQPPATSYARLQAHEGWRRGKAASADAWDRYQHALEDELRLWFGKEDDLSAWHALCRAIGVEPPPQTCEQCERAVRRTFVNIIDLVEWGRSRGTNQDRVQTFRNLAELRDYTLETHKIYNGVGVRDDSNIVLRHLLRKIFRGRL